MYGCENGGAFKAVAAASSRIAFRFRLTTLQFGSGLDGTTTGGGVAPSSFEWCFFDLVFTILRFVEK